MNSIHRHNEFKSTEVDWLDAIPSHWDEAKVKYLFNERVEKGFPDEPLLAATQTKGVVRKEDYENSTVTAQKDLHLLKLVRVGDFVISLRSFQGGIEVAHYQGIISPAYTVMDLDNDVVNGYIKHLFKSRHFINGLTTFVTGIREGQNIDYSKFRRSFIPIPPSSEQKAIANFLDKKTAEIKRFIELKEKTIELLKEKAYKIAVNGLKEPKDVDEWEDNFPTDWDILKGKWIFEEIKIKNKPTEELLAVTQDRGVIPKSMCDENFVTPDEKGLLNQKLVLRESYVISLRSFQGGIEFSYYQGIVSPAYTVFKIKEEYNNERLRVFYKYFLKSAPFIELLNTIISGIRDGQNISYTDFSTLILPLPDIETQNEIYEIDRLILAQEKTVKRKIALIKEYQESLISDAVTGKIDVREYATEIN